MAFGKKKHWGKALHIKGNTAGTSNELSFSVLDATKQEMDRKHGEARRIKMPGRLDLFTVDRKETNPVPVSTSDSLSKGPETKEAPPDVSRETESVSSLPVPAPTTPKHEPEDKPNLISTEEERALKVQGRKARRRNIRVAVASAVAVVVLVAGYFGITSGMDYYQRMQRQAASAENILANFGELDAGLKALDDAIADPLSDDLLIYAVQAQEFQPQAEELLESTSRMVSQLLANAQGEDEVKKVQDVQAAVDNRQKYVEAGYAVLDQAVSMNQVRSAAQDAWDQMLSADAQTRAAASEINGSIGEKLDSARKKTAEAADEFQTASEAFVSVGETYELLDVTPFTDYISARVKALGYMIASIDYLKQEKTAKAQESIRKYEEADDRAVQLAKKMPKSTDEALREAYSNQVSKDLARYKRAREKAEVADRAVAKLSGSATD